MTLLFVVCDLDPGSISIHHSSQYVYSLNAVRVEYEEVACEECKNSHFDLSFLKSQISRTSQKGEQNRTVRPVVSLAFLFFGTSLVSLLGRT